MFLTSPEEPHYSLSKLSLKNETANNVWNGNYRLVGNKVREDGTGEKNETSLVSLD